MRRLVWLVALLPVLGVVAPPGPRPSAFAPVAYYMDHCARCHGVDGDLYAEGWERRSTGKALADVIDEMARGPAAAPLTSEQLRAVTALHVAWQRKEPFVAWTGSSNGVWSGEVSPEAKVEVGDGRRRVAAQVRGDRWSARLPKGFRPSSATITAIGGARTVLRVADGPYSHAPKRSAR